jgi:type III secretory pathway component EscR
VQSILVMIFLMPTVFLSFTLVVGISKQAVGLSQAQREYYNIIKSTNSKAIKINAG